MATLLADWTVQNVAEFRGVIGLSQVALAEKVGLSRPTLAKIEAGEPAKLSTVNFLLARLQEEFGDQFDVIELVEVGPNRYDLRFVRREPLQRIERRRGPLVWTPELNALARKVVEVTSVRNAEHLQLFHEELVEILEAYVRLSGLEIAVRNE